MDCQKSTRSFHSFSPVIAVSTSLVCEGTIKPEGARNRSRALAGQLELGWTVSAVGTHVKTESSMDSYSSMYPWISQRQAA